MTYGERVQVAINWLHEHDMHLVALYFDEPDTSGHKHGPFSPAVDDKVNHFSNLFLCAGGGGGGDGSGGGSLLRT